MRRRLLRAGLATAVVALVASVGAGTGQGRTDRSAAPDAANAVSGNIVLAHWSSSSAETALLKRVIQAFERKYPRIHVTRRALDPYQDAILAQSAARRPPDVFYVDSNNAPDWIRQGILEPLDPWINRYKFRTQSFYPRLLGAFRDSRGRLYGFPKDWSPLAMQTNTEMLTRASVSAPTTWASLRTAAQRLMPAVPGGKPICIGPDWARLLAFVHQNGGSFLNATKTQATVNTAAVRQAADFYVGLKRDGLAGSPADLGVGWCGEALGKEKAAIVFEGNWVIPAMAQDYPNIRYRNHPMIRNRQAGNLAFTVSYSIAKDSKNKPAAWTLLTYLTSREGMRLWTSQGLALPARSDVRPVAGRQPFLQAAGHARPWQFAPGFARVITVANNELTAVFEGKQSVNGMLDAVQSEAQRALRRGR